MRIPYAAHGWTAHEFRIMLNDARLKTDLKIRCNDCGKVFVVALPTYLPATTCNRCYERLDNALLRG